MRAVMLDCTIADAESGDVAAMAVLLQELFQQEHDFQPDPIRQASNPRCCGASL